MKQTRNFGFHVGKLDDGQYAAASVENPIFCFLGESEEAVIEKATRAIHFFRSDKGATFDAPISRTKQVIGFVPQRRVEVECEAA